MTIIKRNFAAAVTIVLFIGSGLSQSSSVASGLTFLSPTEGLTPRVFLPIVMNNYCDPSMKCWSGIHLGNKVDDWNNTLLRRIDPTVLTSAQWPRAVVVLSNQVYQINRYPSSDPNYPCRVQNAAVLRPVIFDYIKRAAQAGVRVIIRIYPSPGNFPDWNDPSWSNHRLSSGAPVGPDGYCRPDLYRSRADLGDEMGAIHSLNVANGFSEFGFEPANEPNVEWYSTQKGNPRIFQSLAWTDMDAYFSAVYDWVHTYYPDTRVLTPPMGQQLYAEGIDIGDVFNAPLCESRLLDNGLTGYDMMPNTYGPKNDGVNWHNYWIQGKEVYNFCPYGQHVSIHFPTWLQDAIRNGLKPVTLSEADLASPDQNMGNALTSKGSWAATVDSIRHFFFSEQEFGVSHYGVQAITVSWLLIDNTGVPEQDWHEAYSGTSTERDWFRRWYAVDPEPWP